MKPNRKNSLMGILCLYAAATIATTYFKAVFIDEDNALSSNYLRSVVQDKYGYIWLGSINGLSRYDGYNTTLITPRDSIHRKLMSDDRIQSMHAWKDSYLWIRLRGRLYSCYDIDNNRFVDYTGNNTYQESYRNFTITADSCLWLFGNEEGCKRIEEKDGVFRSKKYDIVSNALPSNNVEFIDDGVNGHVWIGTAKGILLATGDKLQWTHHDGHFINMVVANGKEYLLTRDGELYEALKNGSLKLLVSAQRLGIAMPQATAMAATKERIVIATTGDTYEYRFPTGTLAKSADVTLKNAQVRKDNRGNRILYVMSGDMWYFGADELIHLENVYSEELFRLNSKPHFEFLTDRDGTIWVSTFGNGISTYDPKTKTMQHITKENSLLTPLKTNYLVNIYEDRAGNIWACQEYMGAVCLTKDSNNAEYSDFNPLSSNEHDNFIRLIRRTGENQIYIANMYNGLKTADGNLDNEQMLPGSDDDVVAMAVDKSGQIWKGTRKSGIYVNEKNYRYNKDDAWSVSDSKVSDILCDNKGRVWISFFDKGIDLAEPDGNGGYRFRHFFTGKNSIAQPRALLQDHAGQIWVTSSQGVYLFNPDRLTAHADSYRYINVNGNNDNSDECHSIYEDTRHHVWIGTIGFGAAEFDNTQAGNPKKLQLLNADKGLSNNNVQLITGDRNGKLWFGTDNGLTMYDPKDRSTNSFFLSTNVMGNMFTENCVAHLNNGRIAFGTRHGVLLLDPRNIQIKDPIFQLAVTDVSVNGVSVWNMGEDSPVKGSLETAKEIRLAYNQNSLTFYFSDFDYSAGKNTRYSYMLKGVDKEWSTLSTVNFASYKDMKPGRYTLLVRSCNNNGRWSSKDAVLNIIVKSPWWATWWAYLAYTLLLAGLGYVIFRLIKHMDALRTKVKVENEMTEFKLRFFTNISHEFRTPLTIIKGAMEKIGPVSKVPDHMKQPVTAMQKSTDRMMRLINQLLEFRKMEQGKLQLALEETDVIDFLKEIWLMFRDMAENKQINYQFIPFARKHDMYVDKSFLDKIVYNLLSNAMKYTPSKQDIALRIKHDEEQKSIRIIVEDTGLGVPKERQKDLFTRFNRSVFTKDSIGIGLHLIKELVQEHKGSLTFEENPAGGSIFTVTLSDDKQVYQEKDFLVADNAVLKEENGRQFQPRSNYKGMVVAPMNELHVMVVEDDADIREYIETELRPYFHIDTAASGEEAWERLQKQRPDLLISDVMMTGMTGFDLTRKIRSQQELADMPVILLTALTGDQKRVKGLEAGADAYIEKPFSMAVLLARCSQLIGQRKQLRISYAKEVVGETTVPEIIIEEQDQRFRELLDTWLEDHIKDPSLNIDLFAEKMGYGRTTFYKKVKKITGKTPNEYIKNLRMNRAAELLRDDKLTVAQVSYMVGIEDPYYFSKSFKAFFKITPTEYRKGKK